MVQRKRRARKACQKAMMVFRRVVFALTSPTKVQARTFPKTKAEEDQQGKGKEGTFPPSGLSASETPNEEIYGHGWESDDWTDDSRTPDAGWFCTEAHTASMVATPLNLANHPTHIVLDLGCTRSIGPRVPIEIFEKHAWYYGITTEFCRCDRSFVFETETCMESCIIQFPTTPPCSTEVDVLETGDVPILFSYTRMKNLGMTLELDPKGDTITCPAFGLYSSPGDYSTMGRIVLDLTTLAYQPA